MSDAGGTETTETKDERTPTERLADTITSVAGAVSAVVLIVVYLQQVSGDDVSYRLSWQWEHKWLPALRRWRHDLVGSPLYSEDQIREAARQVMIEARQVLRSVR